MSVTGPGIVRGTQTNGDAVRRAQEAAQRLDTCMRTVMITTDSLSDLAANSNPDAEELTTTLRAMVRPTPGVNVGLLVLEPHAGGRCAFALHRRHGPHPGTLPPRPTSTCFHATILGATSVATGSPTPALAIH
ncbi:MAG TPA: hypothetical protein VIT22_03635 [Pseudoxanthomonas sp.]